MAITIDGYDFAIPVISIKRKGDFLDKYAERTEDGVLHRELIGVYYNYEIKFGYGEDLYSYAGLWEVLTQPVEFHTVIVPYSDTQTYTFVAYFANVSDELRIILNDTDNHWQNLTVNFIAMSPSRTP